MSLREPPVAVSFISHLRRISKILFPGPGCNEAFPATGDHNRFNTQSQLAKYCVLLSNPYEYFLENIRHSTFEMSTPVKPNHRSPQKLANSPFTQTPNTGVQSLGLYLLQSTSSRLLAQEWHIEGKVNGRSVNALADTGANVNAISKDEADRIGLVSEAGTAGKAIRLPSGKICLSLGTARLSFNFNREQTVHSLRCSIVKKLEHSNEATARLDGFINGVPARAVPDTGSSIMAVSASYARQLNLKVDKTRRTQVTFADGSSATTSGIAKARWYFLPAGPQSELHTYLDNVGMAAGARKRLVVSDTEKKDDTQNKSTWDYGLKYEWHVIEDLLVDAILSLEFIKDHDVFSKHEHAFVHTPRLTLAEIFGICELPGGSEGLRNLAEEFLSDLISPEPFTYKMVVRESARQSEIQRKILDLPPDIQAAQLIIEQNRIDSWKTIQNAQGNNNDWTRLRDEYVASLRLQPAQLSWSQREACPIDTTLNVHRDTKMRRFRRWFSHKL
ncbi:hypothetical protein F5Y19DRAFT_477131 [Xylariaceae sp. FL1651]|nr:hypothetical protein F5Y19DRAFT_477131 [Xylariaceae sp. FL1651]